MSNGFLPKLPSLLRPSWATAGMSADTIADIQSRPAWMRMYTSGEANRINYAGEPSANSVTAPAAPVNTSGAVYANAAAPRPTAMGGMVSDVPGRPYGNDNINQENPAPQQPWFSAPWSQPYKEDAPWWMKK